MEVEFPGRRIKIWLVDFTALRIQENLLRIVTMPWWECDWTPKHHHVTGWDWIPRAGEYYSHTRTMVLEDESLQNWVILGEMLVNIPAWFASGSDGGWEGFYFQGWSSPHFRKESPSSAGMFAMFDHVSFFFGNKCHGSWEYENIGNFLGIESWRPKWLGQIFGLLQCVFAPALKL